MKYQRGEEVLEVFTFDEFVAALKPRDFTKGPRESAAVKQMWAQEFRGYAVAKDSDEVYRISIHGYVFGIASKHVVTVDPKGNVYGRDKETFYTEFSPVE